MPCGGPRGHAFGAPGAHALTHALAHAFRALEVSPRTAYLLTGPLVLLTGPVSSTNGPASSTG
eukprot:7153709-Alexandrium_andersonii.AAC.1